MSTFTVSPTSALVLDGAKLTVAVSCAHAVAGSTTSAKIKKMLLHLYLYLFIGPPCYVVALESDVDDGKSRILWPWNRPERRANLSKVAGDQRQVENIDLTISVDVGRGVGLVKMVSDIRDVTDIDPLVSIHIAT
jgi:hypothetical protein